MKQSEIEALDALYASATAGVWNAEHINGEDAGKPGPGSADAAGIYTDEGGGVGCVVIDNYSASPADAAFIAAIHNAWPAIRAILLEMAELEEAALRSATRPPTARAKMADILDDELLDIFYDDEKPEDT
jgi:hypothetical protein